MIDDPDHYFHVADPIAMKGRVESTAEGPNAGAEEAADHGVKALQSKRTKKNQDQ